MYAKGIGFEKYTGSKYQNIRSLREGKTFYDNTRKKEAKQYDSYLIKNFKSVPIGRPSKLNFIYRGVDLRHAKPYGKNILFIESRSYMSFSKTQKVAKDFPKIVNKDHGILVLNVDIIPRRTPVIYNGLWGMKSVYNEEEVLLPPGILFFHQFQRQVEIMENDIIM